MLITLHRATTWPCSPSKCNSNVWRQSDTYSANDVICPLVERTARVVALHLMPNWRPTMTASQITKSSKRCVDRQSNRPFRISASCAKRFACEIRLEKTENATMATCVINLATTTEPNARWRKQSQCPPHSRAKISAQSGNCRSSGRRLMDDIKSKANYAIGKISNALIGNENASTCKCDKRKLCSFLEWVNNGSVSLLLVTIYFWLCCSTNAGEVFARGWDDKWFLFVIAVRRVVRRGNSGGFSFFGELFRWQVCTKTMFMYNLFN